MYAYVIIDCIGKPCVQYISKNRKILEEYKETLYNTYKDTTVCTLFLEEFNEEDLVIDVKFRDYIIPYNANIIEAYHMYSNKFERYK